MTQGKLRGMKAVSDDRGVIAAAAMDQRGSLKKALEKEKGGTIGDAMMEEFKTLVTEVLTPHASAILLDPEWGLPASRRRARNAGLLMAYEKTGYDKTGRATARPARSLVGGASRKPAPTLSNILLLSPFDPDDVNTRSTRGGTHRRRAAPTTFPSFLEFTKEGADDGPRTEKKPGIVTASRRSSRGSPRRRRDEGGDPRDMKFVAGPKALAPLGVSLRTRSAGFSSRPRWRRGRSSSVGRREQRRVH
jgi:tagatose 1,6-diphosphate aldolase